MDWQVVGETFVTLLVIMDPIAAVPVFIGMTREYTTPERQRAAVRATIAAGTLVIGFALVGKAVLDYLDVSVGSLSIAGGLLLLLVALEMLRGIDQPSGETDDVALVPLATPLVAGPGAIATVIVLTERNDGAAGRLGVIVGILGAVACVAVVLLLADRLARSVPATLINFLTRVFGLLLSAIAVQLVVDGAHAVA